MERLPGNSGAERPDGEQGKENFDRNFGADQARLAKEREAKAKAERLARLKEARKEAHRFIEDPEGVIREEERKKREALGLE